MGCLIRPVSNVWKANSTGRNTYEVSVILPESDSASGISDVRIAERKSCPNYLQITSDPSTVPWTIL
jgi:hypothetical protein